MCILNLYRLLGISIAAGHAYYYSHAVTAKLMFIQSLCKHLFVVLFVGHHRVNIALFVDALN